MKRLFRIICYGSIATSCAFALVAGAVAVLLWIGKTYGHIWVVVTVCSLLFCSLTVAIGAAIESCYGDSQAKEGDNK